MHNQSAHRSPALRSRVRPQEHSFAASRVIADCSDQMRSPDPSSREEHNHVDFLVGLHFPHGGAGFFFRGHHDFVLHYPQSSLHESSLRTFHDGVINEWHTHGVLKPILVNTVDDESDIRFSQLSSLWVRKSARAIMAARNIRYWFICAA